MTAKPKSSCAGLRMTPANDRPWSSGGVNVSTPTSQRKRRPPWVTWKLSQSIRVTVASCPTRIPP